MSEQPIYPGPRPMIGAQLPECQALVVLATTAGHLPPVHVTANPFLPARLALTTVTLSALEAWRSHLGVPTEAVQLHAYATSSWLSMDARLGDVGVQLVCHVELPFAAAELSPAEDAARRQAALLVQRHELEDAAVPPLAAVGPTATVEVRTLADAHDQDFQASVAAGYVTPADWDTAPAPAVADVQTGGAL